MPDEKEEKENLACGLFIPYQSSSSQCIKDDCSRLTNWSNLSYGQLVSHEHEDEGIR